MPQKTPTQRVALLIDADNIQLDHIKQILHISDYYGTLTIFRAYGDWKQLPLSTWHGEIKSLKIKTKQVDRVGKDTTDKKLLIEAGEILGANAADAFIIVSGDGDFRLLCERIKQTGRKVIGIGNKEHSSKDLQKSCSTFYFIEDLEKELLKLKKEPSKPKKKPSTLDNALQEFEKLLDRAFLELPPDKEGWVDCAPLGTKLRELAPNFESRFGSKRLSTWLKSLNKHFERRDQMVRRINRK